MIIPDGFCQANFQFTGANAPNGAEMTMGFDVTGATGDNQTVAEDISGAFTTTVVQNCSSSVAHVNTRVKFGPNATGPTYDIPEATAGGNPSPAVAPNTAVLIQKRTDSGGRRGRGRWYLPGLSEENVDSGGIVLAALVTATNLDLLAFLGVLDTAVIIPVVLHDTVGIEPTVITSLLAQSRAATQRRRLRP